MRLEDFGVNPKNGKHSKILTRAESVFLGIFWIDHVGEANRISASDLARKFASGGHGSTFLFLPDLEHWKRECRHLQNHLLREHDIPILSKAGNNGGYFLAESEEEADQFYETFRRRGLTGLVKAARGKRAALVDMVKQLSLEFDDLEDRTEAVVSIRPRAATPTDIEIVDALLERVTENPERFADGLRKIGEKYGGVLLSKERIAALKARTADLQKAVEALG